MDHDRGVETIRSQLGEAALRTAWAEGRAMTLEQAVGYALDAGESAGQREGKDSGAGVG